MVNNAEKIFNLQAEATLDKNIQFEHPLSQNHIKPKSIFLTGATGFLGVYLVNELLQKTTADIYYLIRCHEANTGKKRLQEKLEFYSLWQEKFSDIAAARLRQRLIPVAGDLSEKLLGLSKQNFQELAAKIDVIYHNGAWVNSACPYETLKPTNVLGTEEILRLASLTQTKPVHFISTIAVFFSQSYAEIEKVKETDIPKLSTLKGGYKQSKAIAEELVRIAQNRGLPACIYRPSRIMGDSKTGINGNTQDFLCSLLKGCIQLGKFPALETTINIVPVDYVSQAIVNLSLQEKSFGQAFHLFNSQSLSWQKLFEVTCNLGYGIQQVTFDELFRAVEKYATQHPEDKLFSSLLLMLSSPDTLTAKKPTFDTSQTQTGLANTLISCPPSGQEILSVYFSYFQKSGYFPVPSPNSIPKTLPKKTSGFWKYIRTNIKSKKQAFEIKPIPRHGNLPLSFGQKRLWFVEQLNSGNPIHNLCAAYRLQGELKIDILAKSIQEITRRHEVLRTTFPAIKEEPIQLISPNVTIKLETIDLTEISKENQEIEVKKRVIQAGGKPFDLTKTPLMRFQLLRLAETEYMFIRTIHHIINDVWSNTVFMRELSTLYEAFSEGNSSPLPELPIQYVDFAKSQQQWLQGEVLKSQLDYWQKQLANNIPLLALPTKSREKNIASTNQTLPTYQGASKFLLLSKSLTKAIKALSHQQGVSLFVTLLAAFKTLLYQYSGQKNIVVSSPVAGRQQMETKKLLGYFSNILLLHTNLEKNLTFQELLKRVSQVNIGAQEHQYLPFQELAEVMDIPSAVFSRTMFTLQNVPAQPRKLAGITVTLEEMQDGVANFDLSLSMKEKSEQILGIMRYKTDLFEKSTISQMLENFQLLLESIVANPDLKLVELPSWAKNESPRQCDQLMDVDYVAPRNEVESTIAEIWQQVLLMEKISINTNFFDIGGRSLAMIRVYSKLRDIFDTEISVAELFKYPTIGGMAGYIAEVISQNSEVKFLL